MKMFVKNEGSVWTSYYAVDQEERRIDSIEVRYTDPSRAYLDTYIVATHSADRGTYDALAAKVVMSYETITEKEWKEVKKDLTDFLKYKENFA